MFSAIKVVNKYKYMTKIDPSDTQRGTVNLKQTNKQKKRFFRKHSTSQKLFSKFFWKKYEILQMKHQCQIVYLMLNLHSGWAEIIQQILTTNFSGYRLLTILSSNKPVNYCCLSLLKIYSYANFNVLLNFAFVSA